MRSETAENPRAKLGDNRPPSEDVAPDDYAARMPADRSEATRYFWTYYQRIMADRRMLAERRSDSARDIASDFKVKTQLVRVGFRMARMTPEKLQDEAERNNALFGLFGFTPMDVADEACTDRKFREALETDKYVAEQQRMLGSAVKSLAAAAKERGVDVAAVAELFKFRRAALSKSTDDDVSDSPAADLFDRMDAVGNFLGVWQA